MKNRIVYILGLFSKRVRVWSYQKRSLSGYHWGLLKFIKDNPQSKRLVLSKVDLKRINDLIINKK